MTVRLCVYPGCCKPSDHRHHITYRPPVIVPLCRPHHEAITIINGAQARKIRRRLTNAHRWHIWHQWLAGKLKARRTAKAMEWIKSWDSPRIRHRRRR